ncbi:MAG TPA: CRISPR-associated endonuclease Cas2 [Thermoplasmata archaeon]|nr:CRISPR-associated endonuclease Cas2 [Thermoplasmata archaeon]
MKNMRCIYVVYDIQDDGLRSNLANILLFYGLHRVQYSVFNGLISMEDKYNLLREINSLSIGKEDKIHIFDLCKNCMSNAIMIGKIDEGKEHIIF